MKKVLLTALFSIAAAGAANAGSVAGAFTVNATLAASCQSTTAAGTKVDFGVYTPFTGPATGSPTATISFRCTKGLPITGVALDSTSGSLVGVSYGLVLGADTAGTEVATGADTHNYVVTGSMTAGMAGDLAGATSDNRTLTISY